MYEVDSSCLAYRMYGVSLHIVKYELHSNLLLTPLHTAAILGQFEQCTLLIIDNTPMYEVNSICLV